MKLRTTVFLWVFALVIAVLGAAIGSIAFVFDRETRARVSADLARAKEVTLDLHADKQSLNRQECRVVAEEPRLKAVVATEDIARDTILDAIRTLAETLHAGVFLIVDADGKLIADSTEPDASGYDLNDRTVVKDTLAKGERAGVWIDKGKAFAVQGCRLEFGARVVGALVIGHAIGEEFAAVVSKHTGGMLIVTVDKNPLTTVPEGVGAAEIAARIDEISGGQGEVTLGGTAWYGQVLDMPDYQSEQRPRYLLLRSIDEALAPGRRIIRILLFVVGGAALATILLALGLARRLGRPIDALVARTKAIARGEFAPKPVGGSTETRDLGTAMDRMAKEIDESRTALVDKNRLEREMEIAARIQTSILPRKLVVPGLEIAAKMMAASEVGGDYYDLFAVDGDGCWLAIGDASGHGLTAGLVMMMVQTSFGTLVRANPNATPKEMVRTLNLVLYENIHERLEADRHMTLSLMRYHPSGEVVAAGAHMDAIVWRAATKKIELLRTPGTFLAIAEDIDHVNVDVTWKLEDGDVLVLLTDGVTEAEDASGTAFDYRGVTRVIEATATQPVETIRDTLFSELAKHSPTPGDDATLVVLRHRVKA